MSNPVTVIDDFVFGSNPSYKLPLHNQHTWISQIDAPSGSYDEYVALTHASIQLKNVVAEVFTNDIPRGDKRNKLLVNYDARLTDALTQLRHSNPADKGIFDSYLKLSIEEALPGTRKHLPSDVDLSFLINVYGNAWKYFGDRMHKPALVERILDVFTGTKTMTVEHTVLATVATVTDYTTAAKDGVIELTSEHRDRLATTANAIAKIGKEAAVGEALTKLQDAIIHLEDAPTLDPEIPSM